MALIVKDRVKETTTTTGTGTVTLAGAAVGFQSFAIIGNANTTYYAIVDSATGAWEVGIGTYTSSGTLLSRDTVLESSTGGAKISFGAGAKEVFVTYPADRSVSQADVGTAPNQLPLNQYLGNLAYQDAANIAGNVGVGGDLTVTGTSTLTGAITTTGVLTLPAGTVSAPALTTTGDTNTGMFFPAADTIAFSEGGVEAMRITSAGNVGIGTSSPSAKLSVGGSDAPKLNLLVASGAERAFIDYTEATSIMRIDSDGDISLRTNNAESIRINAFNNVGIGTASPDANLTVNGAASFAAGTALLPSIARASDLNTGFWFPAADTIAASTAGSERLRLDSSGNLGIGTTAPTVKLDALSSGNTQVGRFRTGGFDTTDIVSFERNDSAVKAVINYNGTDGAISFGTTTNHPLAFDTNNTERMRIDSTGTISLGAAPGSESLRVTPVASAVNYVQVEGASGISPIISAQGSGANLNLSYASKGTGSHYFRLQGTSGAVVFEINPGTSTAVVNGFRMYAAISGNSPTFEVSGADTNLDIIFRAKGTGGMLFRNAANATQFAVSSTASAVNYITAFGNTTGSGGYFQAAGSDTNISMLFSAKGTGGFDFYTAGNSFTRQFQVSHVASAVNYLQVAGAATGGSPFILPTGSDANISLTLYTKGTSPFTFATNSGNEQFRISHVASAVNYLQVTGGATGGGATLSSQGSDTNVSMQMVSKGTGVFKFTSSTGADSIIRAERTGATSSFIDLIAFSGSTTLRSGGAYPILLGTNGGVTQFVVAHTASAVNYLQATGGATGTAVAMSAQGSDTNIDLTLTPKGTGVLSFGTYTAGILAQAGYIQIKDAAGNTRNLLVG